MQNILPIWPNAQKFKFNLYKKKFINTKVEYIENFLSNKYKSKFAALVPSARVGIILNLKYKKFDRSKVFKIPKWSSHCLYNSIGYLTNINCTEKIKDGSLLVHYLGQSFKTKSTKFIINDSSDSLPKKNFFACKNSSLSEIVSLPKIIGSYSGGVILTNNDDFYYFLKSLQNKNIELAHLQSKKKFNSYFKNNHHYDWQYSELQNYSLDFNTCENIYENLINFEKNIKIITKRNKYFSNFIIKEDNYRLGPCIIIKYNKKNNKTLETRHINVKKSLENEVYVKRHILPVHFNISDKQLEKIFDEISTN